MPLVAHNTLPTFDRLRRDGITVLSTERAAKQEIRELHVGLLNMMPDAALEATERQFYRLVGESNPIAQFYMHPFTLPTLPRGEAAQAHIAQYYERFEDIRAAGLDALIITLSPGFLEKIKDEQIPGLTFINAFFERSQGGVAIRMFSITIFPSAG